MDSLDQVKDIAVDMRSVFDQVLLASIKTTDPSGACLYASILLLNALRKFAGAEAAICGGGPPMDGGLRDASGQIHGHYWIEGSTKEGVPFLADITADQFGYERITILPLAHARERYTPGDANLVTSHVEETLQILRASNGSGKEAGASTTFGT